MKAQGSLKRSADAQALLETRVLKLFEERPGARYAAVTDCEAIPDAVMLGLAIRGAGICELRIPRKKYDPFLLLDLIERHGRTIH